MKPKEAIEKWLFQTNKLNSKKETNFWALLHRRDGFLYLTPKEGISLANRNVRLAKGISSVVLFEKIKSHVRELTQTTINGK